MNAAAPEPGPQADAVSSLAGLVGDAVDLGRALRELIESELALSSRSVRRLVAGAIVLPILAVGFWLGLHALLVAALQKLGCGWLGALAVDLGIQFVVVFALLHALRRWLHDLTFPHSRRMVGRVRRHLS